jgi:branched-subunit amino acid ABC-type transport system permease component
MMVGMRLQKIMGITVVLALLTAVAAGLSVLNARNSVASPTWTMISRFVVVLVFGSFGWRLRRKASFKGSLFIGLKTGVSPSRHR